MDDHPELKDLKPPAILKTRQATDIKNDQDTFQVLISVEELNGMNQLRELITRLSQKLGFQA